MPHCILEYSSNIDKPNHSSLLKQIHKTLFSTGLFDLHDIKSRILVHEDFFIGDGNKERAFATLTLEILSGRDDAVKKQIAESCLKVLETNFQDSVKNMKFSLTVQIREIHKTSYTNIKSY
jgi:5-carboxymethyl-2-hydroxymuconate isomerase